MSGQSADAVVIEAGHSGPVTGRLAYVGWDVLVLETQAEPGGAVKSAELLPGYVSDLYSAFCPPSVASSALRAQPRRSRPSVDARALGRRSRMVAR